jgi:hypothetical protein
MAPELTWILALSGPPPTRQSRGADSYRHLGQPERRSSGKSGYFSVAFTTSNRVAVQYSKVERLMSALGQKRTLKRLHSMSALPSKADIPQHHLDVRFVP